MRHKVLFVLLLGLLLLLTACGKSQEEIITEQYDAIDEISRIDVMEGDEGYAVSVYAINIPESEYRSFARKVRDIATAESSGIKELTAYIGRNFLISYTWENDGTDNDYLYDSRFGGVVLVRGYYDTMKYLDIINPDYENFRLTDCPVIENPVLSGSKEYIGRMGMVVCTAEQLKGVTPEDYMEFADTVVTAEDYNYFSVYVLDGPGLCFSGADPSFAIYGYLDETGAVTQTLGTVFYDGKNIEYEPLFGALETD